MFTRQKKFKVGDRVRIVDGWKYKLADNQLTGTVTSGGPLMSGYYEIIPDNCRNKLLVFKEDELDSLELIEDNPKATTPRRQSQPAASKPAGKHDLERKQAALKVWRENEKFGVSKSDVARLFGIKQSTFSQWTLVPPVADGIDTSPQPGGKKWIVEGGFDRLDDKDDFDLFSYDAEDWLASIHGVLRQIKELLERSK